MEKLMVVDGSNLLFQMFYGMPARIINKQGKAIQGTLGFVGALLKMIRMVQPTYVAVLFDGEYQSARKDLDSDYKGNRPDYSQIPEEETPFSQLADICAALDFMGIRHCETTDCEADDWISGYADAYGGQMEVVIVSQDSDFFQLINDWVNILRYRGKQSVLCDPKYIREKLGIEPVQYAAYKSLTGDSADNIRGVDKVGPKTAAALMRQFGDLDTLLEQTDSIPKPSIRISVSKHRDRIQKNYALIKLAGCENLPFALEELAYCYDGITTTQVLKAIGLRDSYKETS